MTRPAPGYPAPEGYEHVAEPDPLWRLVTGKRCRYTANRHVCGQPSVAELDRGQNFWPYCASHMWGRWVESGQVMDWVLRTVRGE